MHVYQSIDSLYLTSTTFPLKFTFFDQARGIRVIACTALTTAWIAAGRLTAHYGYDISSWDLAAGALLIQEAGGMITDIDGSKYTLKTRNMLCSNGHVHDQVLTALKEADAVTFERSS